MEGYVAGLSVMGDVITSVFVISAGIESWVFRGCDY